MNMARIMISDKIKSEVDVEDLFQNIYIKWNKDIF